MEHIIIKPIGNGYLRLTPEAEYILVNVISGRRHSEAVVKEGEERNFMAVETN